MQEVIHQSGYMWPSQMIILSMDTICFYFCCVLPDPDSATASQRCAEGLVADNNAGLLRGSDGKWGVALKVRNEDLQTPKIGDQFTSPENSAFWSTTDVLWLPVGVLEVLTFQYFNDGP